MTDELRAINCLYSISRFVEENNIDTETILRKTADVIPPAMQHPEITYIRITFEGKEYKSAGFAETPWKWTADIVVDKKISGQIEAFLAEEKLGDDGELFTTEDRKLISIIVERLGHIIERLSMTKELLFAAAYNRNLIEAGLDPLVTIGPGGKIMDVNHATEEATGYSRNELIGTDFSDYFTEPEKARNGYKQAFEFGFVRDYPLEIKHRDGNKTPVLYNASVYRDEEGHITGVFAAARDISERKKMEKTLLSAAAYNRNLIEAGLDPLVTIGPDGKIMDVNHSTEEVTGYSRNELIGKDFSDYFTEPEKARNGYKQAFEFGFVRDYPLEIKHRNGGITSVLYNASVYRDETGRVIGVFAAARDITERKRLETVTATSAYHRSLIETSLDPLFVIDTEGKLTDVNQATEEMTGYPREELIGTHFYNYFTDPEKAIDIYHRVFNEGTLRDYLLEIRHRSNKKTPVLCNTSVFRGEDGCIVGAFAAARDISERKKAEDDLHASEAKYRLLLETLPQKIFTYKNETTFSTCNENFARDLGIKPEELAGKSIYDLYPKELADKYVADNRRVINSGVTETIEEEYLEKGQLRWVQTVKTPLHNPHSGAVGVLGIFWDITERKKMEEEIHERELRLRRLLADLERSNKELEQFAYVASHDLQEPLRMVSSYTQLLARRYKDKLDSDADEFIGFAVDGANRMQRLINDLLNYSRITTRGKPMEETDSYTALGEALSNLGTLINETSALVTNDDMPIVRADYSQLVQVLQNLIGNAIKFRGTEPPRIHVSAVKQDHRWKFSVRDNGIGIDLQYKDRIFIIFQRLHAQSAYPGTGIGLALCKRIVERHGGEIWLESEPGNGSVFYFTLFGKGEK